MKRILLLSLSALLIFTSCKKDDVVPAPIPTPVPVPLPVDDTARVLLKDVLETNLPSPFYHFEYDNNKYATKISFASDLHVYSIQYQNKRISKMINTRNNNQILYTYTNSRVSLITELSGITGGKEWEYHFEYNNDHQLTQIRWIRFDNGVEMPYRKALLSYYADGNLSTVDNFRSDAAGQLTWSSKIQYKDYDNGVNVSGFSLMKDFFETLLYLPAVRLHKNNPGTEIITGSRNDYKTTYTYQYSNGLPVKTTATSMQTRGSNAGQVFVSTSQYSYY